MFASRSSLLPPAWLLAAFLLLTGLGTASRSWGDAKEPSVVRTAQSGRWSSPDTWENGRLPEAGDKVHIRRGHEVQYDGSSDAVLRSIHISGQLRFATNRDTKLCVGLIKIQSSDDLSENGFDCEGPFAENASEFATPALEVGMPNRPVAAGNTALIRLTYVEGMDKETCPAIVCCDGRMDFHGAPIARPWVKLFQSARVNESRIVVPAPLPGWKEGDRIILTATTRQIGYIGTRKRLNTNTVRDRPATEVRTITSIDPWGFADPTNPQQLITLDRPLEFEHVAHDAFRGDVANLSRNVIVESADPKGVRGHTMYHHGSAGSISYAEFRHLGKEGVLGKYPIHFHLCGNTMRGSSVVGASIWDSGNRWITIHGTNYLVVRDCIGYDSVGHGFFLEDGTEIFNTFDGNLACMACKGKPLPKQVLPYDENFGSGFWWANSLNAFLGNVACENDEDGYRFDVIQRGDFDPVLPVMQPDGTTKSVDIRTLPFVRFDGNEAHCHRLFGVNLGGFATPNFGKPDADVEGIGPDPKHAFVLWNTKIWDAHWAFHCGAPYVRIVRMDLFDCTYGFWRSVQTGHQYDWVNTKEVLTLLFQPRTAGFEAPNEMYPSPDPVDDLPPITVITHTQLIDPSGPSVLRVRGTATDNFGVAAVTVNGRPARAVRPGFLEWEIDLLIESAPSATTGDTGDKASAPQEANLLELVAQSRDVSGIVEKLPHRLRVWPDGSPISSPASHKKSHTSVQ